MPRVWEDRTAERSQQGAGGTLRASYDHAALRAQGHTVYFQYQHLQLLTTGSNHQILTQKEKKVKCTPRLPSGSLSRPPARRTGWRLLLKSPGPAPTFYKVRSRAQQKLGPGTRHGAHALRCCTFHSSWAFSLAPTQT